MLSIIILAAGRGTRMKSNITKIIHEIAHQSLINHVISQVKKLDLIEIIIVVNKDIDTTSIDNYNVKFAKQEQQLGTADAVRSAISHLSDKSNDILIVCGDTPLITNTTLANFYQNSKESDLAIIAFDATDPTNYGRVITEENKLIKIVEHKDANENELKINLCNSAITFIKKNVLLSLIKMIKNDNMQSEFYFTDIISLANLYKYKCSYYRASEEEVTGVNDRIQLALAELIYQNRMRKQFMQKGVTLIDPNSVYFSYDTKIERDVIIYPNVYFGPNVVIDNDITIKSFSHLEGVHVKSNSIIGPFARIRPDTVIEEDSRIGNFVEIKNSQISQNTKINHLSYIGDSVIGKNTNIGAGVITCNYDGYSKHQTQIGDDVFVGSNSCIIAPIIIDDNVIVAAGSVIDKDIEKNALAISRPKLEIKSASAIIYKNKRRQYL